ncbi:nitroreductase family deazaflavin-dependent oxidoreductase [Streptomyces coacervatus]|uniref:Nitroreductase family deazaflavin-dependent oxidoreductase n=1 Tax=Streptomyces coacervatus TaxID=647381 RepID=A0ABP7IXI5_9ACTN|nr:nitroreductase/quinone reductase family protein [Streptomyces coacervatus]MDF2269630.1 nitroreductase/quinone reductase family protein [Streptomyces coacervatus]
MSFEASSGTRGARQPGRGTKWFNKWTMRRIRRKGGGKLMGMDALVLTTVGRKSGEPRETPVGWFPGKDGSWIVVASAAGAAKNPAWYYNLAAHPDRVQVQIGSRKVEVTAEQLHGEEREEAWRQITAAVPRFAQYQVKTDRELPIIRLVPRSLN